ncbi:hypothetical protein MTO96_022287 [Rhipicephalus appendiculatus]
MATVPRRGGGAAVALPCCHRGLVGAASAGRRWARVRLCDWLSALALLRLPPQAIAVEYCWACSSAAASSTAASPSPSSFIFLFRAWPRLETAARLDYDPCGNLEQQRLPAWNKRAVLCVCDAERAGSRFRPTAALASSVARDLCVLARRATSASSGVRTPSPLGVRVSVPPPSSSIRARTWRLLPIRVPVFLLPLLARCAPPVM